MLSAKTATRKAVGPADDTQEHDDEYDDELGDELDAGADDDGEDDGEEPGGDASKRNRKARKKAQRAEAHLTELMKLFPELQGVELKGVRLSGKRLPGWALVVSLPSNVNPMVASGGYFKTGEAQWALQEFLRQTNAVHTKLTPRELVLSKHKPFIILEAPSDFLRRYGRQAWAVLGAELSSRVVNELVESGVVVMIAQRDVGAEELGMAVGGEVGATEEQGQAKPPLVWGRWENGLCNGGKRGAEYKIWVRGSDGKCACGGSCELFRNALDWPPHMALIEWSKTCYSATNADNETLINFACKLSPDFKAKYLMAKKERKAEEVAAAEARGKTAAGTKFRRAQEQAQLDAGVTDDDEAAEEEDEAEAEAGGTAALAATGVYDTEQLKAVFEEYNMAPKATGLAGILAKLGGPKKRLQDMLMRLKLDFKQPTGRQVDKMCSVYQGLREEGRNNPEAITGVIEAMTAPGGSWTVQVVKRVLQAQQKFTKDKPGRKPAAPRAGKRKKQPSLSGDNGDSGSDPSDSGSDPSDSGSDPSDSGSGTPCRGATTRKGSKQQRPLRAGRGGKLATLLAAEQGLDV